MNTDKLMELESLATDMDNFGHDLYQGGQALSDFADRARTLAAALRAEQAYKVPADLKLGENIYTPPGEEVRFAYTRGQPNNVNAWRLGEACRMAADASASDYIDRGLGLLKELEERGYGVFRFVADAEQAVGAVPEATQVSANAIGGVIAAGEWVINFGTHIRVTNAEFARGWNECRALGTARQSEGVAPNYAELLAAVRSVNGLHCLGDAIYGVREREGEGWEGPNVMAYSAACEIITKHLAAAPGGEGEG